MRPRTSTRPSSAGPTAPAPSARDSPSPTPTACPSPGSAGSARDCPPSPPGPRTSPSPTWTPPPPVYGSAAAPSPSARSGSAPAGERWRRTAKGPGSASGRADPALVDRPGQRTRRPRTAHQPRLRRRDLLLRGVRLGPPRTRRLRGRLRLPAGHRRRPPPRPHRGHSARRRRRGVPDARLRPRWHVRFQVDDLTAATEAARKAGGEVSPPTVSPDDGPESMIEDPDGALFTVSARRSPTPAG